MKKLWIIVLATLALVGLAAGYALRHDTSAASALGPRETVQAYYDWYLDYIGDRATGEFRNPLVTRAYRDSPYLAPEFSAKVDALIDSFQGTGGYDPFLMAQDVPSEINAGEALINGDAAIVPVTTSFAGHSLEVTLYRGSNGVWLITDIVR